MVRIHPAVPNNRYISECMIEMVKRLMEPHVADPLRTPRVKIASSPALRRFQHPPFVFRSPSIFRTIKSHCGIAAQWEAPVGHGKTRERLWKQRRV